MNILKIGTVVLGILLVASVGFATMVQMSNMKLTDDLSTVETELSSTKTMLQANITMLNEKITELGNTESFIEAYFKADGKLYTASDIDETATGKYDLAGDSYTIDDWDSAITHYGSAMTYYNTAGQKYRDARDLYKNAENYTDDTTYQSLCTVNYNLMDSASQLMYYMYESAEYMQSACQYYKNGDYNTGGSEVDSANVKITLHDEEIEVYNNYLTELHNILMGLS